MCRRCELVLHRRYFFVGGLMKIDSVATGPYYVNTYIVPLCGNDVFVVDPADCLYSEDRFSVVKRLKEKNLNPVAVILTHGHFDHVSGIKDFKSEYPDVPILIHRADAAFIGPMSEDLQERSLSEMSFLEFLPTVTNLPAPNGFLEEGKTLAALDVFSSCTQGTRDALSEWEIISTPGHTPGSICLYNQVQKLLISGDTLFYMAYGRTDLPLGDEAQLTKSIASLHRIVHPDALVYPGHEYYGFPFGENGF